MYKSLFQGHFLKLVVWLCFAVTTHVVRLKLFRLKAEGVTHALPPATQGKEENDCRTLAECDSCIKHGFKMRFFLTVFGLQPIHLSSYVLPKSI